MKAHTLFDNGERTWTVFGRDPERESSIIDTNQYLITHRGRGLLIDPGGIEVFPSVLSAITGKIQLQDIEAIFASHQDPDIISSMSLWLTMSPEVKIHISWVWTSFVAHYGGFEALVPIPDEGKTLSLGGSNDLRLIPAHYCHSSGNFSLYDPEARILFSGDLGAAILDNASHDLFVEDFDKHIPLMEGFHKRWMPSNAAKNRWVSLVRQLDVDMLCPQHGAIFRGKDVGRFLDWLEALEVGQLKTGASGTDAIESAASRQDDASGPALA